VASAGGSADFLARAANACAFSRKVTIYVGAGAAADPLLSLILLLMPLSRLPHVHLATCCDDPEAFDREDVVFTHSAAPAPSWTAKLTKLVSRGRQGADAPCLVDVAEQRAPGVRSPLNSHHPIREVLEELGGGADWPPLSFHAKYSLLMGFVDALSEGRPLRSVGPPPAPDLSHAAEQSIASFSERLTRALRR
jgi:hypothetical protein